jgi:alkylated DNA repair protein (DNA oxidative demethylase)
MDASRGFFHLPGFLGPERQEALVALLFDLVSRAPFFTPVMPRSGRPFSVVMTNLGSLGWVSDRRGYRYQPHHPATGEPWPAIPEEILAVWREVAGYPHLPEACLVNYYRPGARMGLHRDVDEEDLAAPVVSISLGDSALFRIGGNERQGPTRSLILASGDVAVLAGEARLAYHGIDRVMAGTSRLVEGGGRLNLTLRRVRRP